MLLCEEELGDRRGGCEQKAVNSKSWRHMRLVQTIGGKNHAGIDVTDIKNNGHDLSEETIYCRIVVY